jgi:hypothetical protein
MANEIKAMGNMYGNGGTVRYPGEQLRSVRRAGTLAAKTSRAPIARLALGGGRSTLNCLHTSYQKYVLGLSYSISESIFDVVKKVDYGFYSYT